MEDYVAEQELENLRSAVEKESLAYVEDHFPNGACTVYVTEEEIVIAVVDNKYNPNNFWNGRWLAHWIYNTTNSELKGISKINVHYYEDGNVQLNTEKKFETQVPKTEVSKAHRILCNLLNLSNLG